MSENKRKQIDAIIKEGWVDVANNRLHGKIFADSKSRFPDGLYVTTSQIVSRSVDVIHTKNSTYYVASWMVNLKGEKSGPVSMPAPESEADLKLRSISVAFGITSSIAYKAPATDSEFEQHFDKLEDAVSKAADNAYLDLLRGLDDPDISGVFDYKQKVDLVLRWRLYQKEQKQKELGA